jgi:AraC family transcriptional regulator of adaptative response / DNA-3-methyladenine glycosylase II
MPIDPATAHAALEARDRRFDGQFFTGVTSTGIYCRCICPARTPKPANRRFFPSAAAAEGAGFRPCLVCRPECAPGLAPIDAAERLAAQALHLIEAGVLEDRGAAALAALLGISDRHLRRVTGEVLGATPIALAQSRRLLTAKRLLQDTALPITEVAFSAGFGSLRRFNALFKSRYGLSPNRLRRTPDAAADGSITLTVVARGGCDPEGHLAALQSRAVAGLEHVDPEARLWQRSLQWGPYRGWIEVRFTEDGAKLRLAEGLVPALRPVLAGLRAALDFDADRAAIAIALTRQGLPIGRLARRLHGEIDPFETAVRTVLGQQVTRRQARQLAGRLVAAFGTAVATPFPAVDRLFPTPQQLAALPPEDIAALGMPRSRAQTVKALAAAVASGQLTLARGAIAAGRAGLAAVPGIGPWTVEYVALRGLGDPDAFPLGDAVLDRMLGARDPDPFRPWRAYTAIELWAQAAGKQEHNHVGA